ncbi:MAG: histidine kinase [Rudaea sp.]
MKPLRPQLSGLIFKLTLFYVLLSLPCLMMVESAILIFEFDGFMRAVDNGSLRRAAEHAASDLASSWPSAAADESNALATWTQAWVLRLQRPRNGLVEEESYVLIELATDPLAAAVLSPDGRTLAKAPETADWRPDIPRADTPEFASASQASKPVELAGADSPYRIRRLLTPVRSHDGNLRGYLFVELRLPVPWRRFLLDVSLEWPIVLGYLIVFGIASSFFLATWVTRRLNRVARAASAWSRGDFTDRINDRSRDELGRLSGLLDRMALELKDLLLSRAQLATLAERQRLARDLHDTVKQKAFALNLQLATARRQLGDHPAGERVFQAERLSQQIQHELVQILDELRADGELSFADRLRMRAVEWSQVSGMLIDIDIDAHVPASSLSTEEALLRIADEALANVLRHSGATAASLAFHRQTDGWLLRIGDNGSGTSSEARSGMGLSNMRERALRLANGRFDFDSGREGTIVSVFFSAMETHTL